MKNMQERFVLILAAIIGIAIAFSISIGITKLVRAAHALKETETEYEIPIYWSSMPETIPETESEATDKSEEETETETVVHSGTIPQVIAGFDPFKSTDTETTESDDTTADIKIDDADKTKSAKNETSDDDIAITTIYMEQGVTLDPVMGVFQGPWLKETYYNLDMSYCIEIMEWLGYSADYWVRTDGVKMYGSYIMCAADTNVYPKGSIVETSLGTAMVVDHCEAAEWCPEFDVAVIW